MLGVAEVLDYLVRLAGVDEGGAALDLWTSLAGGLCSRKPGFAGMLIHRSLRLLQLTYMGRIVTLRAGSRVPIR